MYLLNDAVGAPTYTAVTVVFYFLLIWFGAFFVVNLLLAVIFDNFSAIDQAHACAHTLHTLHTLSPRPQAPTRQALGPTRTATASATRIPTPHPPPSPHPTPPNPDPHLSPAALTLARLVSHPSGSG
eukprot:5908820-Prymnesium_polylepis.1